MVEISTKTYTVNECDSRFSYKLERIFGNTTHCEFLDNFNDVLASFAVVAPVEEYSLCLILLLEI
jgi:hypothetical protein